MSWQGDPGSHPQTNVPDYQKMLQTTQYTGTHGTGWRQPQHLDSGQTLMPSPTVRLPPSSPHKVPSSAYHPSKYGLVADSTHYQESQFSEHPGHAGERAVQYSSRGGDTVYRVQESYIPDAPPHSDHYDSQYEMKTPPSRSDHDLQGGYKTPPQKTASISEFHELPKMGGSSSNRGDMRHWQTQQREQQYYEQQPSYSKASVSGRPEGMLQQMTVRDEDDTQWDPVRRAADSIIREKNMIIHKDDKQKTKDKKDTEILVDSIEKDLPPASIKKDVKIPSASTEKDVKITQVTIREEVKRHADSTTSYTKICGDSTRKDARIPAKPRVRNVQYRNGMDCPVCKDKGPESFRSKSKFVDHWFFTHLNRYVLFYCSEKDCTFSAKSAHEVRLHVAFIHFKTKRLTREVNKYCKNVRTTEHTNKHYIDPGVYHVFQSMWRIKPQKVKKMPPVTSTKNVKFKTGMKCPVCKGELRFYVMNKLVDHWIAKHRKSTKVGQGYDLEDAADDVYVDPGEYELSPELWILMDEQLMKYEKKTGTASMQQANPEQQKECVNSYSTNMPNDDKDKPNDRSYASFKTVVIFRFGMSCPVCGGNEKFEAEKELIDHWFKTHKSSYCLFKCPFPRCRYKYVSGRLLSLHIAVQHRAGVITKEVREMTHNVQPTTIMNAYSDYVDPGVYQLCQSVWKPKPKSKIATIGRYKELNSDRDKDSSGGTGDFDLRTRIREKHETNRTQSTSKVSRNYDEHMSRYREDSRTRGRDHKSSRDSRERESTRDGRERESSRDSRERESTRDGRERESSRDSRERESTRDGRERESSRDSRERESARDSRERESSRDSRERESARNSREREMSRDCRELESTRDGRERESSRNRRELEMSRDSREQESSRNRREREMSRESRERESIRNRREREMSRDSRERESTKDGRERESSRNRREREMSRESRERESSRNERERELSRDSRERESTKDGRERESAGNRREREMSRDSRERESSRNSREQESTRNRRDRESSRDSRELELTRNRRERESSRSHESSTERESTRDARDSREQESKTDRRERRSSRRDYTSFLKDHEADCEDDDSLDSDFEFSINRRVHKPNGLSLTHDFDDIRENTRNEGYDQVGPDYLEDYMSSLLGTDYKEQSSCSDEKSRKLTNEEHLKAQIADLEQSNAELIEALIDAENALGFFKWPTLSDIPSEDKELDAFIRDGWEAMKVVKEAAKRGVNRIEHKRKNMSDESTENEPKKARMF